MPQTSYLNLGQKIGLKQMINQEVCIILKITLNSTLQSSLSLVYVIIVMHTYLVKDDKKLPEQEMMLQ